MRNSEIRTGRPEGIEVSFHKSAERDVARYVSGSLVREEVLEHTRLVGLYWSATGHVHRENVTSGLPGIDSLTRPLHVFELEIDGQSLHNRWDWVQAYERESSRPGCVEAVVELKHQVRPVLVKVVTRLDGTQALARWIEITNVGGVPAALSKVVPWCGLLWKSQEHFDIPARKGGRFTLGYMRAGEWGYEGSFDWIELESETFKLERDRGTNYPSPYTVVKDELTGEMAFIALAWPGNWWGEFTHRVDDTCFFRIGPLGPAPLRVIDPGETVCSPEVHLMLAHTGLDEAARRWHDHVRASVVPPRPPGREMYTIAGRVVEEPDEWILREIDIAAEMGVEAFMVDAGWYGEKFSDWWKQRGDWEEGDWMPGGMLGVRDYAKKKGLLFGVWHEAEAMSEGTKMFREHTDWALTTDEGRRVGEIVPNLALPDVAKYVEDSVLHVIRDYQCDFYKLDYNVAIGEGGQTVGSGYAEHESWRHFEAIFRTYERARKEFPNVALENCAGGGGRNDLGMLGRFHYCCESDWSVHPFAIRTINAMTLFLPPEAICYYHNHIQFCHQTADLDTHLRVILFATPIFVGFGAQSADRNTEYFQKAKRYIELAKTFCRPVMANRPVVYHHTPDIGLITPSDWCVLEYASSERGRGYAGVFRLLNGPAEYVLRLRGVDPGRDYRVTLDNTGCSFEMRGSELVTTGLTVRLDAALTSELVMYEVISG